MGLPAAHRRAAGLRVAALHTSPYRLPLCQPWMSAHGTRCERQGWIVSVQTADGALGYGDCAPLPEAGTETLDRAQAALLAAAAQLCGATVEAALAWLPGWMAGPAARCAVETALLDRLSRDAGLPLAHLLSPGAVARIAVNASLGALDARAIGRARRAVAAGFRVLKLKVGLQPWPRELALLRRLAALEDVHLRLDANGAWPHVRAQQALTDLAGLPVVESVEEPLARPSLAGLAVLQDAAPFPLAVDESLGVLGAEAICRRRAVRRVVLKPQALGGVRASWRLARLAARQGLECVVTSAVDSAIGVWAGVHLAAAVSGIQPGGCPSTHGLATSTWLRRDLAAAPRVLRGTIALPPGPGLGVVPGEG